MFLYILKDEVQTLNTKSDTGDLYNTILKTKNRNFFMHFGRSFTAKMAFWVPENAHFCKQVLKWMFLKTIPLSSLCKLQKHKCMKQVSTCMWRTLSDYRYVSLQSDFVNYLPGMHNTEFVVVVTYSC